MDWLRMNEMPLSETQHCTDPSYTIHVKECRDYRFQCTALSVGIHGFFFLYGHDFKTERFSHCCYRGVFDVRP